MRSNTGANSPMLKRNEISPEERAKEIEKKVHELLESSAAALQQGKHAEGEQGEGPVGRDMCLMYSCIHENPCGFVVSTELPGHQPQVADSVPLDGKGIACIEVHHTAQQTYLTHQGVIVLLCDTFRT